MHNSIVDNSALFSCAIYAPKVQYTHLLPLLSVGYLAFTAISQFLLQSGVVGTLYKIRWLRKNPVIWIGCPKIFGFETLKENFCFFRNFSGKIRLFSICCHMWFAGTNDDFVMVWKLKQGTNTLNTGSVVFQCQISPSKLLCPPSRLSVLLYVRTV